MAFTIQLNQLRTPDLFEAERALREAQKSVRTAYHSCSLDALCEAVGAVHRAKQVYDKAVGMQHRLIADKAEAIN
jgi:Tfp pilus assembly protein PilF